MFKEEGFQEGLKVVSTLDGRLIETTMEDREKSSRIAIMGAVMYGSLSSMLPQDRARSIRAKLPRGFMKISKADENLLIQIFHDGKDSVEKP